MLTSIMKPTDKLTTTIAKATPEHSGFGVEKIVFKGKHFNYEASFYADEEDNYDLIVEDFGRMYKGKWQQLEPSSAQINLMNRMIANEIERLTDAQNEPEPVYDGLDLTQEDFINYKFN